MTLQKYTAALSRKEKFRLASRLSSLALPIWCDYATRTELTYRDSVVGLMHSVDASLLKDTIDVVDTYWAMNLLKRIICTDENLQVLHKKFEDPIVALQDDDWDLPHEVKKTFYGVFNMLEAALGQKKTCFGEETIYVSINQLIDALESSKRLTFDEIQNMLK